MSKKTLLIIIISISLLVIIAIGYFYFNVNNGNPTEATIVPFGKGNSGGSQESGFLGKGVLQSSVSVDCSADSGYNVCTAYERKESYGDAQAKAYAEVQINTNPIGEKKKGYYLGVVYIPYKFEGDNFYVAENIGSWDNLWDNIAKCNENGCSGKAISKEGKYYLANSPGDSYTKCPVFYTWDYDRDDAPNEDWAWAWVTAGHGWASNGNCFDIKVVECVDNDDCSQGEICDKSGDWNTWKCIEEPEEIYYRYNSEENKCIIVSIPEDEKTELDFGSKEECEENIKNNFLVQIVIGVLIIIIISFAVIIFLKKRKIKRR